MTDLENDECVVTDSLPRFLLVHMAYSCAKEERFSCDQVII